MPGRLVAALDTATAFVSTSLCEVLPEGAHGSGAAPAAVRELSAWAADRPQAHGELAVVGVASVLRDAGRGAHDLDAVVVGVGPGPFTGLRVGVAAAVALGHALDVPVHGVVTLDALAVPGAVVCTDARRREVHAATFGTDGRRTGPPEVVAPAVLAARLGPGARVVLGPGAAQWSSVLGDAGCAVEDGPQVVPARRLVAVVAGALRRGDVPPPPRPMYLRRPDAVPPAVGR